MSALAALTEEEAYLWAIISDKSGLDLAEFTMADNEQPDNCFRAWSYQWSWWRNMAGRQIDCAARSLGKSLSAKVRAYAFPFNYPGQEMVITAPEGVHLDALTDVIETAFLSNKLGRFMLSSDRSRITHRPFKINFANDSRIMGRIPQHDGKGIKGSTVKGTLVLTRDRGLVPVEDIVEGDFVWSHLNRWTEVRYTYSFGRDHYYSVSGQGAFDFIVSDEHRFYTRHDVSRQPGKTKRALGPLRWDWADEMPFSKYGGVNSYWTGVSNFGDALEFELPQQLGSKEYDFDCDSFWWLVGRYVADGHVSPGRFCLTVHPKDQAEVIKRLEDVNIGFWIKERDHSSADIVECGSKYMGEWLKEHFGFRSSEKTLPTWVLTLPVSYRQALLDGYVSGDGHTVFHGTQDRVSTSSASKSLTLAMGTLATTLGYSIGYSITDVSKYVYKLRMNKVGRGVFIDDFVHYKISSCDFVGEEVEFFGLVCDDHSYWADGVIHHNTHPVVLEMDEGQDYPEAGWTEIIETLKMGSDDAIWRVHGVTRGVRDHFYKFTQPDSGFTVHKIVAMARPTWTNAEREAKIELYGSRDHPDYRRNVLGRHGDSENVLFILNRLMQCVDLKSETDYNAHEFTQIKISPERIDDHGSILNMLDVPASHMKYESTWVGMDVGYVSDPSELVVFVDENQGKGKPAKFKLVTRISMERVAHGDQVEAILWVLEQYKPQVFAMDSTGIGLPLYQTLLAEAKKNPVVKRMTDRIKGYNFSEKILAEIDTSVDVDPYMGDLIRDAGIMKNVLEWSTDVLRSHVDEGTLVLPHNNEIISQFQGQTFRYSKAKVDQYGRRRIFSQGSFHVLDACRMAALARQQRELEPFLIQPEKKVVKPVFMFA